MLGRNVTFNFTGSVSGTNLTITPTQLVSVTPRLELTISTESK
jgi:hypothetical protein